MAFEIKYDKNGMPLRNQQPVEQPEQTEQPTQPEQSAMESLAQPEQLDQEAIEESAVESESNPEKQPQPIQSASEKQSSGPRESWKQLREKALQAEKRAQELEAALLAAQAQKQSAHQPEAPQEAEEEVSLDADALVEGKHLSKVNKHIKKLEQQLAQYQQQTALSATELRLKTQYPDFDKVVSKENLESFRIAYPELATTLNASTDLYSKAVSAYTMIKRLGIGEDDPYIEEKALVQRNAAKPKPLASINPQQGDSPLSRANAFATGKLSDDMKKQLWREMNEIRKG